MAELHRFFMHVVCDRGSVSFWGRCDTLFTSGFVDDVIMFSHSWPHGSSYIFVIEERAYSIDSNQDWGSLISTAVAL